MFQIHFFLSNFVNFTVILKNVDRTPLSDAKGSARWKSLNFHFPSISHLYYSLEWDPLTIQKVYSFWRKMKGKFTSKESFSTCTPSRLFTRIILSGDARCRVLSSSSPKRLSHRLWPGGFTRFSLRVGSTWNDVGPRGSSLKSIRATRSNLLRQSCGATWRACTLLSLTTTHLALGKK